MVLGRQDQTLHPCLFCRANNLISIEIRRVEEGRILIAITPLLPVKVLMVK